MTSPVLGPICISSAFAHCTPENTESTSANVSWVFQHGCVWVEESWPAASEYAISCIVGAGRGHVGTSVFASVSPELDWRGTVHPSVLQRGQLLCDNSQAASSKETVHFTFSLSPFFLFTHSSSEISVAKNRTQGSLCSDCTVGNGNSKQFRSYNWWHLHSPPPHFFFPLATESHYEALAILKVTM